MTTDTVKDVRSIGSGRGSSAAVSDGGNSNAGSSPLACSYHSPTHDGHDGHGTLLISYDARNGRSKWLEPRSHLSGAVWPGCCGGSRTGPGQSPAVGNGRSGHGREMMSS